MFRLMLLLLGFVGSSLLRPDDPEPDATPDPADPKDDKPGEAAYKQFSTKTEHDDYINGVIEERLKRKDAKLEEDKERIEREAKEKALKDNEDWKALAQTHAETVEKLEKKVAAKDTQIEELNGTTERVDSLEKRLRGIIKPKLEQVPELFRPFVESMGVEEQAEWFEKNADKLEASPAPAETEEENEPTFSPKRPAGQPPTGAPATGGKDKQKDEEASQAQRSLGISRI